MDRWAIPLAGLLLFAGATWYCVETESRAIERDIAQRATAALLAGGIEIPPGGLKVDGQDVTLSGPQGSPVVSGEALRRVEAVWGVGDVAVHETSGPAPKPVVATAPAPAQPIAAREQSPDVAKLETELRNLLTGKTVQFATASDVLLPSGRRLLDQIARALASSPSIPVDITGYTDGDGDPQKNLDLSKRRAAAVKRYLVSRGIAAARLSDDGRGSADPIADNKTPQGRARNRRIEFHAKGGKSQ